MAQAEKEVSGALQTMLRALNSSKVVGTAEIEEHLIDDSLNDINAVLQRWNDRRALERLSFSERYEIGQSDIGFLFMLAAGPVARPFSAGVVSRTLKQLDLILIRMRKANFPDAFRPPDGRITRDDGAQRCLVKIQNMPGKNQKPMFILGVETEYPAENWIPVSVWLERTNISDDVCAGELYLSASDLSLKPLLFADKGKHERVRVGRLIASHAVDREIKRGPKIVDNISDHQRPVIGERLISFGNDQILVGLRPMLDEDPEWAIMHEFFNVKPKLLDMLLGPPNL
jgi:hypothetical protein